MGLLGRMEKMTKSQFQESGASKYAEAVEQKRQAAKKIVDGVYKTKDEQNDLEEARLDEFTTGSIIERPSILFEGPVFFPMGGMDDTQKFNASFKGVALFLLSVALYYALKGRLLTGGWGPISLFYL